MIHTSRPVDASVRPTAPLRRPVVFSLLLLASRLSIWYNSASPWAGNLRAKLDTFRNLLAWSRRSDEKAAEAAVSCVERQLGSCRDSAKSPRWLRGSGWFPADRQRLTSAYDATITHKTGQRQPSTRWAILREESRDSTHRTQQTKALLFGLTDRRTVASNRQQGPVTEYREPTFNWYGPTWQWCALLSICPLYRVIAEVSQ